MVYSNGYQEPCPHQNHQRQVEPTLDHPRVKETDKEKKKEFITSLNGRKIRNIGRNLKSYGKPGQARRIHHLLERNFGPTSNPKEKTMWALVL